MAATTVTKTTVSEKTVAKGRATNVAVLTGRLSRPPEERVLASGTRLASLQLTLDGPSGTETVPVVWLDPSTVIASLGVDDAVVVSGRVRRRFFRAGGHTQSRTEVVAATVVPVRRARAARAAVAGAIQALADMLDNLDGRPD